MRGLLAVAGLVLVLHGTAVAQQRPTYTSPGWSGRAVAPATKPVPPPATATLAEAGKHPDVLVDEAGTAHLVWATGRGDEADGAVYCRLKRSTTACDHQVELVPEKPYGTGDGPQYDIDDYGPEIVRIGDQLAILTFRYPTFFDKPDGGSSGGVVGWVSSDGGQTWSASGILARWPFTDAVAFGSADAPRIATLGHTGLCGMCLGQIPPGRYDGTAAELGGEGPDRNYSASLALDGGTPVAAFSDLGRTSYLRRWTGAEPLTDAANWTSGVPVPGDEADLAGGPGGLFVTTQPEFGGDFVLRRVTGATLGPAARLTDPGDGPQFTEIEQGPDGRLLAAWKAGGGAQPGIKLRTGGPGGGALGRARVMVPGTGGGQLGLASAGDGGGFLVANATGGVTDYGQIVATGFGTPAPTGAPGLAGLPGGGAPGVTQSCAKVGFGAVDVQSTEGCFLQGTGRNARMSVSEGEVDLNGLKIIPDANVKIVIDPRERRIFTTGDARVVLAGGGAEITLWHGDVRLELPRAGAGAVLASFDTSRFGVDVLGFAARGKVDVLLTDDGVRVPVSLALPPYMGDVRGEAELRARTGRGLEVSSLGIHVGNVFLGPVLVERFDLTWTAGGTWDGKGKLVFPAGGALDASVRFEAGRFAEGSAGYTPPPPGIAIGPAVHLTNLGVRIRLDPTLIEGTVRIGAGAAVNGVAPVNVTGTLRLDAPARGPFTLTANGTVSLFFLDVGGAEFKFISDGYASFKGRVDLPLPAVTIGGAVDGFVDGRTRTFGASAEVDLCIDLSVAGVSFPCVGADLALSQTGMAACGSADLPVVGTVSGGLELPWSALSGAELVNPLAAAVTVARALRTPCNTGAYRVAPPRARAAQAGPATVTVPGGLPSHTIALVGDGGAPDVDVRGPGGAAAAYVARSAALSTTYVVLTRPAAGAWTVTPKAGSAPVREVLQSDGFRPARVAASLRRGREIRYRIADGDGQRVRFVESGAFGTSVLGTARGTHGTLRFRPTAGRGGTRTVRAEVLHDGLVIATERIGRYTAPRPRAPGRAKRVRVRRGTVTWTPVRGAARYLVRLQGSHGLRRQVVTRRRVVRVRLVPGDRLRASVVALGADGRRGPAARSR